MPQVVVSTYNTIVLEEDEIYRLTTPYCGTYFFNVLNLGPCTVYLRDDEDPEVGDEHSEIIPPGGSDNMIAVPDGPTGLRFRAGPPCVCECEDKKHNGEKRTTITVRLVRG